MHRNRDDSLGNPGADVDVDGSNWGDASFEGESPPFIRLQVSADSRYFFGWGSSTCDGILSMIQERNGRERQTRSARIRD